jgi:very-short-patch-repair endonuclease
MVITVKPLDKPRPRVRRRLPPRGEMPGQVRQKKDVWKYSFPPPNISGKHSTIALWKGKNGTVYQGTMPEWAVFWALEMLGAEFRFQSPFFGGRSIRGGAVVDFVVFSPVPRLIIRVQGFYFHLGRGGVQKAVDLAQKLALESTGFQVIDIVDTHALLNPIYYVKEAFRGMDHSRSARSA